MNVGMDKKEEVEDMPKRVKSNKGKKEGKKKVDTKRLAVAVAVFVLAVALMGILFVHTYRQVKR